MNMMTTDQDYRQEREAVTAEEFLAAYAERSHRTPAELLADGRVVATCHCDYEKCEGWQLIKPEHLLPWHGNEVVIAHS